ncbi:MAG: glycosyltransferase family 39 protein [Anaerolineales bacterium]|jgi:hypothetical protein
MAKGSEKPDKGSKKRGFRLRDPVALARLLIVIGGAAMGGWLLWQARGGQPPIWAFVAFGFALLALLIGSKPRLRLPRRKRPAAAAPQFEGEPTVLDWFKSLFRGKPIPIPEAETIVEEPAVLEAPAAGVEPPAPVEMAVPSDVPQRKGAWLLAARLRLPIALGLALLAQRRLDARLGSPWPSVLLYLAAAALAGWALWNGDMTLERPKQAEGRVEAIRVRLPFFGVGIVLSLLTYSASSENTFRASTVILWVATVACFVLSMWQGRIELRSVWLRMRAWFVGSGQKMSFNWWGLIVLLAFGAVAYFRFADLADVPYEMWSDHAEKLNDVMNVLKGDYSIFFPSNTGREPLQFYIAAATVRLFGTGLNYTTLKIGTALVGLLTLPYVYLFGREIGGRKVGLAAMILAGVGYWPNSISRFGLRFPFYPLFAAPALYYLVRGLRTKKPNDLLLCGVFTGLGFYGYSPARIIPLAVAAGVLVFLFHRVGRSQRSELFGWLMAAGIVALVIFVPLLHAAVDMPSQFLNRTLTRLTDLERPLPGSPLPTFLTNVVRGLGMFNWDNGGIWAISITHRPALDWVTGALFVLGVAMVVVRYIKRRDWRDLFLLLAILILMLPSTLSLAFPNENPAPNRASGAMVPVFTLAAIGLAAIPQWARTVWQKRWIRSLVCALAIGLIGFAAVLNHQLVFVDFDAAHRAAMLNTRDAGEVVRGFADTTGSLDTAHVVPYPYWFDTRLISIVAGEPEHDIALWPEQFESTLSESRPQLFLLHPDDEENLANLQALYPDGVLTRWHGDSHLESFYMFYVNQGNR